MMSTSISDPESGQATAAPAADPPDEINEERESDSDGHENIRSQWRKERSERTESVGAMQVDEPAPQLNRLFYRGRSTPRERIMLARALSMRRQAAAMDGSDGSQEGVPSDQARQAISNTQSGEEQLHETVERENDSAMSGVRRRISRMSEILITAMLVEDSPEGEVVAAEPVRLSERKWASLASVMCILLVVLTVSLSVTLILKSEKTTSLEPSFEPSPPPSFDQSPTLEIIQTRGKVTCGESSILIKEEGINLDLCRAIAAVLIGDPDSYEAVIVNTTNRWQTLLDRKVDLLTFGSVYTLEREIREKSTGVGFAFSSPYDYGGLVFHGKTEFVECAEKSKRYNGCSSLSICVPESTTWYDLLINLFPSDYLVKAPIEGMSSMLINGTCNVVTSSKYLSQLEKTIFNNTYAKGNYTFGEEILSKEPLAIVTRKDDREFSDIVNWIIHTILHQEGRRDPTLCQNYTDLTSLDALDLNFKNAVHCVGNVTEIFGEIGTRIQLENGTSGLLYAIPFGNLDSDSINDSFPGGMLAQIRKNNSFNCGVAVPANFVGKASESDGLVRMGVEYCRTLAAALHNGDHKNVMFDQFPEADDSSFIALSNRTIDVLVGGKIRMEYDFKQPPSRDGAHFSTPYYYGNETGNEVSIYSIATREDDALFASFVNSVVLATIYAQENEIHKEDMLKMPLVSLYGSDLKWALRDAVAYSGNYDDMYSECFKNVTEATRGRNVVNKDLSVKLKV